MMTRTTTQHAIVFLTLLLLASTTKYCHAYGGAIVPSAELYVWPATAMPENNPPFTLLVTQALYGPISEMNTFHGYQSSTTPNNAMTMVHSPDNNILLCENNTALVTPDIFQQTKGSLLIVPRGTCSFEWKTYMAQTLYGASAVAIYNTLGAQYRLNETVTSPTVDDIFWPVAKRDYDCDKGKAEIASNLLNFDNPLPYNSKQNDPLLSGGSSQDNLCKLHDPNNLHNCDSQRCLVAHDEKYNNASTSDTITVCCAWDMPLEPVPDGDLHRNITVTIPTLFLTMQQGDQLKEKALRYSNSSAMIYSRWKPTYNPSSLLIWMLGVLVAALAAYSSASEYHVYIRKCLWKLQQQRQRSQEMTSTNSQQPPHVAPHRSSGSMQEETLELEPIHALFFVIMASTSLLVLFFFKIYSVVKVMYAIGCSNAVIQIITYPLLSRILNSTYCRGMCCRERTVYKSDDFGDITNWDVTAALLGYAWGMSWLYMALFVPHPDANVFFWVTQDIMGACMCITFLGLIQLNNIQVAAILLIVAFVYDIFFVFVTPLLFHGKSVMITVATSGGPPEMDAMFCQKYPTDPGCRGGDPLPMLLTVPRLFDYEGGASMLGLGDIVLPGLLLSFAARLDASKSLVALASGAKGEDGDGSNPGSDGIFRRTSSWSNSSWICCLCSWISYYCCTCCCGSGTSDEDGTPFTAWYILLLGGGGYYFVPLVIAYAVGLLMANAAVYLMQMGQPALLYLVPCTLGTMTYLGWKRQELRALWDGPKVIAAADEIIHGRRPTQTVAVDGGETGNTNDGVSSAMEVEERDFVDDETGDVPLLTSNTSGDIITTSNRRGSDNNVDGNSSSD
ncbi:signal peptide peptidase [Nitzschia inconspicua]|uniref:Signal peptide peptidase n=1 Tax=Nitzschia inconspicua TaxID=303405 RepID=A0A9K3PBB6_9STRA|nr:signal peptide peptidase [Nitzschia inconspicua]